MTIKTKVSIITSVYNDELYIEQSVVSILNQTYKDFEYIIVDDGSTDNTTKILSNLALHDKRIKFYKQENMGPAKARNRALAEAVGDYIVIQDSDDISIPDRISKQIQYINTYDIVTSYIEIIDDDGNTVARNVKNNDIKERLLSGSNPLTHGSLMIKKSLLDQVGGYDAYYKISQDFDLYLRMIEKKCSFYRIKDVLYKYRLRKGSVGYTQSSDYFQRAYNNFLFRKQSLPEDKTPVKNNSPLKKIKHIDRIALAKFWCEEYNSYLIFCAKNILNINLTSQSKYIAFSLTPKFIKEFIRKRK